MSSNLYWEPRTPKKSKSLSTELKLSLRKRYDGGLNNIILDSGDVQYLEGLSHAGIKDATVLINAIRKHDEISINEIF